MEIKKFKLDNGAYRLTITSSEKVLIRQTGGDGIYDDIYNILDDVYHITMENFETIKRILLLNYDNKNYFDLVNDVNSINKISFQVNNELGLIILEELGKIVADKVSEIETFKERIDTLVSSYTD